MRLLDTLHEQLPDTSVRRVVVIALVLQVLTAWFNAGHLSPDEHWQILEFAWYKLGHAPASSLPWEFAARMRPGLQPWLAAGVIAALERLGAFTPFVATFVLRLASGLLGLWAALALCARCLPEIRRPSLRQLALLGTLFLWAAPFLRGRFASETWSGALAIAGICLALDGVAAWTGRRGRSLVLSAAAGCVWALAFYCRFQIGFAVAGAAAWLLLVRRPHPSLLLMMGIGLVAGLASNLLIDHWLYGAWVLTPLQYWSQNVLHGKASLFGTAPWWATALPFLIILIPPFSVPLVGVLLVGVWRCRRHVLVWTVVPFVVAHALVPHKELRFMVPVVGALVPLLALSLDSLPEGFLNRLLGWCRSRVGRAVMGLALLVNAVALAVLTVVPSPYPDDPSPVLRRLWDAGSAGPVRLYSLTRSPYATGVLRSHFYMAPHLVETPVRRATDFLSLHEVWHGERISCSTPASIRRPRWGRQALRVCRWLARCRRSCAMSPGWTGPAIAWSGPCAN